MESNIFFLSVSYEAILKWKAGNRRYQRAQQFLTNNIYYKNISSSLDKWIKNRGAMDVKTMYSILHGNSI